MPFGFDCSFMRKVIEMQFTEFMEDLFRMSILNKDKSQIHSNYEVFYRKSNSKLEIPFQGHLRQNDYQHLEIQLNLCQIKSHPTHLIRP